eukprot:gene6349-2976_t
MPRGRPRPGRDVDVWPRGRTPEVPTFSFIRLVSATSGAVAASTSGTAPAATSGAVAASTSETAPAATSGAVAACTSGTAPAATSGAVAASTSGTAPAPTSETTPAATSGAAPAATSGAAAASTSGTALATTTVATVAVSPPHLTKKQRKTQAASAALAARNYEHCSSRLRLNSQGALISPERKKNRRKESKSAKDLVCQAQCGVEDDGDDDMAISMNNGDSDEETASSMDDGNDADMELAILASRVELSPATADEGMGLAGVDQRQVLGTSTLQDLPPMTATNLQQAYSNGMLSHFGQDEAHYWAMFQPATALGTPCTLEFYCRMWDNELTFPYSISEGSEVRRTAMLRELQGLFVQRYLHAMARELLSLCGANKKASVDKVALRDERKSDAIQGSKKKGSHAS